MRKHYTRLKLPIYAPKIVILQKHIFFLNKMLNLTLKMFQQRQLNITYFVFSV